MLRIRIVKIQRACQGLQPVPTMLDAERYGQRSGIQNEWY